MDFMGLAEILVRPLDGLPIMVTNPLDDYFDTEIAHEQIFMDDGSNVGYSSTGPL